MAGVVVRDVGLFLEDGGVSGLQDVVVGYSVELVGVVASHEDGVEVGVVERALGDAHVATDAADLLMGEALCLVPGPEDDFDVWLGGEGDEHALLVGGSKVNRHELLGVVVSGGEDLSSPKGTDIKDRANSFVSSLTDGKELLGWTQGHG